MRKFRKSPELSCGYCNNYALMINLFLMLQSKFVQKRYDCMCKHNAFMIWIVKYCFGFEHRRNVCFAGCLHCHLLQFLDPLYTHMVAILLPPRLKMSSSCLAEVFELCAEKKIFLKLAQTSGSYGFLSVGGVGNESQHSHAKNQKCDDRNNYLENTI